MMIDFEVTEGTTIRELREVILKHFEDNPTHGSNCACLDRIIGGTRQAFHKDRPQWTFDEPAAVRNGWYAVDYVLSMARAR